MGFSVIKIQAMHDQGSGMINEDVLLIKDNTFGVFDGATSLTKFSNEAGETGAKIAARIAAETFATENGALKECALIANKNIRNAMLFAGIDVTKKEALWSTVAAVVRLDEDRMDFFQIADCLILVLYTDARWRLLTEYHNHDLETLRLCKRLGQERTKNMKEALMPHIVATRQKVNKTFGSLNGEPEAVRFFQNGTILLHAIKSVLLFTDGFIIPTEDPDEPEQWELMASLYRESGLVGIRHHIRMLERSDTECFAYPRTKPHDDIAAIAIDFI